MRSRARISFNMKSYHIHREGEEQHLGRVTVRVTFHETELAPMPPDKVLSDLGVETMDYELTPEESLKIENRSPTGFEFGYGGSGPSQLALAILLDFKGKAPAPPLYQAFKWKFIAPLKHPGGIIPGQDIQDFLDAFWQNGMGWEPQAV